MPEGLGSLANTFQSQMSGMNTWDWQGGEPAPAAIRTPWLASNWHYDEQGRIVPNDLSNPWAPWNRPGATMTMDEYYESMPANSGLFAGGVKPVISPQVSPQVNPQVNSHISSHISSHVSPHVSARGGFSQSRDMYGGKNWLLEAIKRARGGF